MIRGLAMLAVLQSPIQVTTNADRVSLPVGDEVVISVRAMTREPGAFRTELPQVPGLTLLERTERVDPLPTRDGGRAYALDLRFRAAQLGVWRYGPMLVYVGAIAEFAPEVTVTVIASAGAAANPAANPRLLELLRSAPPPRPVAAPTLAVLVSSHRVVRGDQLDVLTVAWFPRSVRARLRRPPTLKPPVLQGVWSIPQPPIPGVLANVTVDDEVYDLFASHQIAFPLAPGRIVVPPARVEYAVPAPRRDGAGERTIEAASAPDSVIVVDLPSSAGPAGFDGPVARDVSIGYRVRQLPGRAGELLPVDVVVTGAGNLAFWPTPVVEWPAGTRAYLEGVDEEPRRSAGLLGGGRVFRFLLLPDSAGSVALPPLRYAFFDPARSTYREASASGMVVPVLEAPAGLRRTPVPLASLRVDWPHRAVQFGPGRIGWWASLGLLALLVAVGAWSTRRGRRTARGAPAGSSGVEGLERIFLHLTPNAGDLESADVVTALRRAGIDRVLAAELVALRGELDRVRFAPNASPEDGRLRRSAAEAVSRIPRTVRRRVGLGIAVAVFGLASPAAGQRTDGASRYRDGDYRGAVAAFRADARTHPDRWQVWYNIAAAEYLAGQDADAAAALIRARALAPRAALPLELWETLRRQYEPLHEAGGVWPLSRAERWLLALALAVLAAVAWLIRRRPRWLAGVPAIAAGALVLLLALEAALEPRRQAFVRADLPLRVSPHGLAPERGGVSALSRVTIDDARGGWVLVRDRSGSRGWIAAASIAGIRGVD